MKRAYVGLSFVCFALMLFGGVTSAQTVQLPTFHYFGASTSVLVPDRGSVWLGGVGSAASGSSQFGPGFPANRATSSTVGASGVSVSAQIHDFEAMDAELLKQAALRGGRQASAALPNELEVRSEAASPASVAELRSRKAMVEKPITAEALYAQAEAAEAAGRIGAARVYYQMSARRATGPLRDRALAKYHSLGRPGSVASSQ